MSWQPASERNDPLAVRGAWAALEALSPRTFRRPEDLIDGNPRQVADFLEGGSPWQQDEPPPEHRKRYYLVVLGCIPMQQATDDLVTAFGRDEERVSWRQHEKAAISACWRGKYCRLISRLSAPNLPCA